MSEPLEVRVRFGDVNPAVAEHPNTATLTERASGWLQLNDGSPDAAALAQVVPAVIALVDSSRARKLDDGSWHPDTWLGAVMLAARLTRRRNSPAGIDGFTADGAVAYVRSNDPDVAVLLRLNAPAIG